MHGHDMRQYEFFLHTDAFNSTEVQDHFINPCCFGEDFALWLQTRLAETAGEAEVVQEDWGWCVLWRWKKHTFTIGIQLLEGGGDGETAEWRVFADYERMLNLGWFNWFFSKHVVLDDTAEVLEDILRANSEFKGLRRGDEE